MSKGQAVNTDEVRGVFARPEGIAFGPYFIKAKGPQNHQVYVTLKNGFVSVVDRRISEVDAVKLQEALVAALDSGDSFTVADILSGTEASRPTV